MWSSECVYNPLNNVVYISSFSYFFIFFFDLWSQKKCHTVVRMNTTRVRLVSRTEMMAWHSREVFQSAVSRSHTVYNGTIQSLLLLVVLRIIAERNVTNYGELDADATKWCVITINMLLNEDVMDIFREKKFPLTIRAVSPFLKTRSDQKTKKYSHCRLEKHNKIWTVTPIALDILAHKIQGRVTSFFDACCNVCVVKSQYIVKLNKTVWNTVKTNKTMGPHLDL